jgi:hypothetical protein
MGEDRSFCSRFPLSPTGCQVHAVYRWIKMDPATGLLVPPLSLGTSIDAATKYVEVVPAQAGIQ